MSLNYPLLYLPDIVTQLVDSSFNLCYFGCGAGSGSRTRWAPQLFSQSLYLALKLAVISKQETAVALRSD